MSSLAHPRGPEPPRIYWLRRAVVVAALVATILVLSWVARLVFGGRSATAGPVATPNASSLAQVATASATTSPSASPTATSSASASNSPSPSPSASATSLTVCDPSAVGLTVNSPQSVKSGATATIAVAMKNNSGSDCKLNFGSNPLSIRIYSGADKIWSTADCSKWAPTGVRTLKANGSWTFSVGWPTKRSASGCALKQTSLEAGTYVVNASYGSGTTTQRVFQLQA